MAVCLVPDFPAVKVALEHLTDLDKQLREVGVSFTEEASHHLTEIAKAITELESSRKAAHEELEVETIETSKLRHQLLSQRDDIMNEISAGVSAARDVNSAELDQLQTEVRRVLEETEFMQKRQKLLEEENAALLPEQELMKSSYAEIIQQLNQQLSEKADQQISLNQLRNDIQTRRDQISHVETSRRYLQDNIIQERKQFTETKEMLEKELNEMMKTIQDQRKINADTRRRLDLVSADLLETEDKIKDKSKHISQLEKSIIRLNSSNQKHTEQLEEEIRQTDQLHTQHQVLEKDLEEMINMFQEKIQALQEKTAEVEVELSEEQKVKSVQLENISELSVRFTVQRKREDDALADQHSLSKQLERGRQRIDECLSSISRYKLEVRQMEEEMQTLHETNIINAELFQKNLEELDGKLSTENQTRVALELQRDQLSESLEKLKEEQKQKTTELNSQISFMKEKHTQLLEEEKKLLEHEAMNSVIDDLTDKIIIAEEEQKQIQINYRDDIQQLTIEAESINKSRVEKEETLKVLESELKEVETQFNVNFSKNQTLTEQTTELQARKIKLELFIQDTKEKTDELLKPKEDLKRELQMLRAEHLEKLVNQSADLKSTETNIYQQSLNLEQVSLENSRLHLRIEQMKEEINNAEKEKKKHTEQINSMKEEVQSLCSSLMEAWLIDKFATEESTDQDQKLLEEMQSFIIKIQKRKLNIGEINTRLGEELKAMSSMLDSSKSQHT